MLMMGTFLVAESIEACGLHRRIALKTLSLLGTEVLEYNPFLTATLVILLNITLVNLRKC